MSLKSCKVTEVTLPIVQVRTSRPEVFRIMAVLKKSLKFAENTFRSPFLVKLTLDDDDELLLWYG